MNSKRKGKEGELECAKLFKAYGYDAHRTAQCRGNTGQAADVEGVPYLWIEVKRDEHLNVEKAIQQAERDSLAYYERTKEDTLPMVIHRKNNRSWQVTMRLSDLLCMSVPLPFVTLVPTNGLVTMSFEDWIDVYRAYEADRRKHD